MIAGRETISRSNVCVRRTGYLTANIPIHALQETLFHHHLLKEREHDDTYSG